MIKVFSKAMVLGAGGFIGGHLTKRLARIFDEVIAIDVKSQSDWWYTVPSAHNVPLYDISAAFASRTLASMMHGTDMVFDLAADMGGMGFIADHDLDCLRNVRLSVTALEAAKFADVERFFFSSSACVYPSYRQISENGPALREDEAYPADPEDGYGWEKLYTERLCEAYRQKGALDARAARYHNVYGPFGSWQGGREKAPAALCRKVAEAKIHGHTEIDIWGDGEQTRTFLYVDDCVDATLSVMTSAYYPGPVNIGSSELITVNQLAALIMDIADMRHLTIKHVHGPEGVRGRSSDNTLFAETYGYEPVNTNLTDGLAKTYAWVYDQVTQNVK